MRAYVAGPMTGYPELNFPLFHRVTAALRQNGIEAINPAEINPDPGAKWEDCMRSDLRELLTCDSIVMLPGWSKSRGASLEHHVASTLGMQVLDALDLCPSAFVTAPPTSYQAPGEVSTHERAALTT